MGNDGASAELFSELAGDIFIRETVETVTADALSVHLRGQREHLRDLWVAAVKGRVEARHLRQFGRPLNTVFSTRDAVERHVSTADLVIGGVLIPGASAPKLVSAAMVRSMKPGSVIVDLAVERGGNVEGAEAGKVVTTANDVKIVGHLNVPGRIAASASLLYARNLFAFLETMVDKAAKQLAINKDDELVKATMLTDAGAVVHPTFAHLKTPAAADAGAGA